MPLLQALTLQRLHTSDDLFARVQGLMLCLPTLELGDDACLLADLPRPAKQIVLCALGHRFHEVPTLGGKAEIDIPEGTQHGKTFRLRGKGIKGIRSSYPGDLYCHIVVETPVKLTEHQRKLLKELDESFKKGGEKHSPHSKSWTDRVKNIFK